MPKGVFLVLRDKKLFFYALLYAIIRRRDFKRKYMIYEL